MKFPQFGNIGKNTQKLVTDNAPVLLTGVGVVGLITTAYLSGKASYKAHELLEAERQLKRVTELEYDAVLTKQEKALVVWKLYIPAVSAGIISCTAIIMSNRISARRAAGLAAAYTLAEKAHSEYKEKVTEALGMNKEQKIVDGLAQEKVDASYDPNHVIKTGNGDQLFFDPYSGRYFESTMEEVKSAQNNVNHHVLKHGYANLNDWYDWLALDHTKLGAEFGWNRDKLMDLKTSTTMSTDNRACIVLDFTTAPYREYERGHL